MTEYNYRKFDEKVWYDFGKALLNEQGSEKQKNFLQICKSGKTNFSEYIDEHLYSIENSVIGNDHFPFRYRFTEREFLYPPEDTQKTIWERFRELPHEALSYCGFWGYTVVNMIKEGYIEPDYLASSSNGVTETGIYCIDKALRPEDKKTIDRCVRRVLRSMCNPFPRGKRIVFNDFYLGKAYWRWSWSHRMSNFIGLDFEQILKILNEDYYAEFSEKMHSGKSYISSKNVLGGLLLYLKQVNKGKITIAQLRKIINTISYLSAWKAIEAQEPNHNQKEIEAMSKIVLSKSSPANVASRAARA